MRVAMSDLSEANNQLSEEGKNDNIIHKASLYRLKEVATLT
jgi:hypothetical protein